MRVRGLAQGNVNGLGGGYARTQISYSYLSDPSTSFAFRALRLAQAPVLSIASKSQQIQYQHLFFLGYVLKLGQPHSPLLAST